MAFSSPNIPPEILVTLLNLGYQNYGHHSACLLLTDLFTLVLFCISCSNFTWHSMINSESIFLIYFPVVCKFILMRERCNDYTYVIPILHTLEVFCGTLDEVRHGAIKTLTRLIPCVQVTGHISSLVHHLKLVLDGTRNLKKSRDDWKNAKH